MAEEHRAEKHTEKKDGKKSDITEKLRKNPWIVSTIILGILFLIMLYFNSGASGSVISKDKASDSLVGYLNSLTGGGVSYVSSKDLGSLYEVKVSYQNQEIPVYTSKDGKYFIQGITPLTAQVVSNSPEVFTPEEIPKSDKPKVELFIMTHCPYGTQAEKGLIPVLKLLNNKIDGKIRFVHYFMHGEQEEKETYNQVCIREEQSAKYLAYLECFLEDGNSSRCVIKTGIDKTKLNTCLNTKAKEYYEEDSKLSSSYGVQGSPTLIVNGIESSSGRSSSAFLTTTCSAFNSVPGECNNQVSSENPSTGFGYSNTGSAASASASC